MLVLPKVIDFVEGLAKVRGYMIGVDYGEAFLASNLMPKKGLGIRGFEITKHIEKLEEG